jgi:peptide/nickel transport system permease protein
MAGFMLRRILAAIPVLLMVAIIVFLVLRLSPGDPAAILAGDGATSAQLAALRHAMGLDRPMLEQIYLWMEQVLRGNLGTSLISGQPVWAMIADRFGPTLALSISTIVFSVLVSIPLGIYAAWTRGRVPDRLLMAGSVVGFSVPVFINGYVLILVFARWLHWLPVQGYQPMASGFGPFAQRLILPTLTLSLPYIALISRIVRTGVIEVMGEDFIRTARAKGLTESAVLRHHALGNAAVPIITIIGVSIGMLISGVVVIESVFNIPGLGRLVLEAVLARDYTVIQAMILLFSAIYVLINLVIDLLYPIFDPRISY